MNKFLLLVVFAVHLVITAIVCGDHGVLSVFPPFSESYTTQIFSDLVIALTLVNIWIYFDLKKMGKPIYYSLAVLIGTALSGSFAPLSYLLVRDKLKSAPVA